MHRKIEQNINIKEWGLALVLALVFALLVKGFVLDSYVVKSQRMEKTLLKGDYIFVNKLSTGARLPVTIVSVPFFGNIYSTIIQLPYMRLPGFSKVKINDIVVFNYPKTIDPPIDKKEVMVKRCVALPGDTVIIDNKKIIINNIELAEKPTMQFNYRVVTNGNLLDNSFLQKFNITEGGIVSDIGIYDFALTREIADTVLAQANVDFVRELKEFSGENSSLYFPSSLIYNWNKDNFGPLFVPKKGSTIKLNHITFYLYRFIIEHYEGKKISKKNNVVFIDGKPTQKFTFEHNYYFMADDNRDNANDSRYWGFVPESHLIGKAGRVWLSVDKANNTVRWNRFFYKPL